MKLILSAAAIVGALSFGLPAMAADNDDMNKPMDDAAAKPMHHMHHHGMRHHAAAHHRMHGAMGDEGKERAETKKLNQEQVQMNGMQH
jgi:hypothetical protein